MTTKSFMKTGTKILNTLTTECEDDWQRVNILAVLFAALFTDHGISPARGEETARLLVGLYMRRAAAKKKKMAAKKKKPAAKKKKAAHK